MGVFLINSSFPQIWEFCAGFHGLLAGFVFLGTPTLLTAMTRIRKAKYTTQCHPGEPHIAKGLCRKCYMALHNAQYALRAHTNQLQSLLPHTTSPVASHPQKVRKKTKYTHKLK